MQRTAVAAAAVATLALAGAFWALGPGVSVSPQPANTTPSTVSAQASNDTNASCEARLCTISVENGSARLEWGNITVDACSADGRVNLSLSWSNTGNRTAPNVSLTYQLAWVDTEWHRTPWQREFLGNLTGGTNGTAQVSTRTPTVNCESLTVDFGLEMKPDGA